MLLSRRLLSLFSRCGFLVATALFCFVPMASAQTPAPSPGKTPAPASTAAPVVPLSPPEPEVPVMVPQDQLMAIGPLPDIVEGSPGAPSTIVEYASLTCTHCAAFHETVWPDLKAKYVDSGKAKFILREFPLDPLATAGFMLARCSGPDKRNLLVDQLFSQQKTWAFVDKPIQPLLDIVKQTGMSQIDFETCLKNQELYDQVNQSRDRAAEAFNIDATPTFFVDGRKLVGELTLADFDRLLEDPAK
jgi:protein-disulfide isomerase